MRSFPWPLGISALPDRDDAVNVAVFAPGVGALAVVHEIADGGWAQTPLAAVEDGVHHGVVEDLAVGARYHLLDEEDPNGTLLLDPYARGLAETPTEEGPAEEPGTEHHERGLDVGPVAAVRVDGAFDWAGDVAPRTPWRDTVIYEAHVVGLTKLHPDVPEELRGTYAGLAHPAVLAHLTRLGVTAIELLPIHAHADEPHLAALGLTNYWGYNTLGFFAPHPGYATAASRAAGPQAVLDEVKAMVAALHAAGLEVILDVVYNHTAEGGKDQPARSWRGLGDRTYYRHRDPHTYEDTTGCGNSLDFSQPRVVQLALDSLRYWVDQCHVDGFRFDLAPTLCRDVDNVFTQRHPFLVAAAADPVLAPVKLIAEPWDIGMGGWQTGNFPRGWADWNDGFRDVARTFWLSDQAALDAGRPGGSLAALGGALAGSAATFAASGRSPLASINLVTAHDGFTLADLTAYDVKHNEANGEGNRDGSDHNRSWNHGVEGPTTGHRVLRARERTQRNLMATLLLSLGVPMITAGDEIGRTQRGNNNAYSQNTAISWIDWRLDERARRMLRATRRLIRVRREFLADQPADYPRIPEAHYLHWFGTAGYPMTEQEWTNPHVRVLQLLLGSPDGTIDGLLVINGSANASHVTLPDVGFAVPLGTGADDSPTGLDAAAADEAGRAGFVLRMSTDLPTDHRQDECWASDDVFTAPAQSITVFRRD
ncbi:glycogen debranching protein GlgX [Tersicoccus solisilvae]|uniref:glycogen debranching protein GlgX n=1 Tax=Tersicoccus solisilvae TaxID=1882339 RepID=UPI001E649E33|nr:glycogen debranching protein GlgX [Tersicoccus solisilvae]